MNTLFVPLIILTTLLIILGILIVILYCTSVKYMKKQSEFLVNKEVSLPTVQQDIAENETISTENNSIEEATVDMDDTTVSTDTEETAIAETVPSASPSALFGLSNLQPTEEVDIIQAAKDAIASLTPFAEAQKIKLHLSTTCEELMVIAVPESIRILFRNIIDNSIKYMGRAGQMIITISLLGDDIFLILKDTGKGLNEEETTHIFELNFQGSNRVSGNGLGLTQSKMIVEAFGGTIYAKSSPENGMAIYIQLPVCKNRTI